MDNGDRWERKSYDNNHYRNICIDKPLIVRDGG